MIFKDAETLANIYSSIILNESEEVMTNKGIKKCECSHAAKGCECDGCEECRSNQEKIEEAKKAKPDYLDVDEDGDKTEPLKKALKDKKVLKERSNFVGLYLSIMNEGQETVCGTKINPQAQYNCVMEDGSEKILKGESVLKMKDTCKSVKPAHKK